MYLSQAKTTPQKSNMFFFLIFLFYIAIYNLLNIDRVISKVEVRKVVRQAPSIDGSLEFWYWARSSGHKCLSRLLTEGLKRVPISWLLCSVLRFLYLLALILTTSVTYGISKSLCRFWLETYQGALLIVLSIFDWNVWRIWVFDGLLHPHSSILYVQMGRSIALYTVSLLSKIAVNVCLLASSCFGVQVAVGIVWLLCVSSTLVFHLGEVLGISLLFWQVWEYCEDLLAGRCLDM